MFPGIEYIKTCLNGLRSRIEKVESWFVSNRPNWAQNDPDALDYVKGRTHYEANGKVVQLPPKFLPSPTSNTAGAIKADVAKTTDTQPVRLGTDGKLYASGIPVFTTSGTGSEYTAHVPEITNLVKGMLVVMIPHTDSASQYPTLIINRGLEKHIARPVSTGGKSTFISSPNLKSGLPYLLIYKGSEWLSINNVRPDALDLLNFVTPNRGGTGLTSLTKGSYIIGNGVSSVQQKTPSEVLADIGAIPTPAAASVGQAIVVKAVDENGKPTEWAPATLPDKLPNPNALTFTGAVTGSYDGSAPLSVEIPSGGGGGSDAWNLIDHFTVADAAISYAIHLQPGAKEYGIYWNYTQPSGGSNPKRSIMVDSSLAQFGVMYRCTTNEPLFLRVFKGPSNILATGQGVAYMAQRFSNGGTYIGSGTDFPVMTLTTDIACETTEIWVYWR